MKLSYGARKSLPTSSFALPSLRKYPIQDLSHAKNALSRVSQFGSLEEKSKVRGAVHSKWDSILQEKRKQK